MSDDYYSILGVPQDATTQDIKRSFRSIARECHPDVSGGAEDAAERFRQARHAYETLMDPVTRARYDRRKQRRQQMGGSFFDAFYNRSGGAESKPAGPSYAPHVTGGAGKRRGGDRHHSNEMDLEDLFNDFGNFGFGDAPSQAKAAPPPTQRPERSSQLREPKSGADVRIELVVAENVARHGGSATAVYFRLRRADSWRPGNPDPGIVRVQDVADIRIIPGTSEGEVLRERAMGDAGPFGGPYGDLVATIRLKKEASKTVWAEADSEDPAAMDLMVSVVSAILGDRVECETPQGRVKLTIPPGTSSGTQFRLKGKGPRGEDEALSDLYVTIQIKVPANISDASRKLIEEFGKLNQASDEAK
jgi:DnaJ-class molecular chaperone